MTEGCVHDRLIAQFNLWCYLSCLPLGEGAERSDAEGGASQLTYHAATKNFSAVRLIGFSVYTIVCEAIRGR